MAFVTEQSLREALHKLHGSADHMLKIWFTLKQMGMTAGRSMTITTSSPTPALQRLFNYGDPDDKFFVPFAHTERYKTMQHDAARSIIQTTIRRWYSSRSVVQVDPTRYLDIREDMTGALLVQPGRTYPMGLGQGKAGFALEDDSRVSIPDVAFAVWYYRQEALPGAGIGRESLRRRLAEDLKLTPAEMELIFVPDGSWTPSLQDRQLTDADVYRIVSGSFAPDSRRPEQVVQQTFDQHAVRVRSMVTVRPGPVWLNSSPQGRLEELLLNATPAILLFGPPRTSKTYAIDQIISRTSLDRETIQIHNGWGYEDLMVGLKPVGDKWNYVEGPLLTAIRAGKRYIVLEEINRTEFSQAIGEVFLLLESAYRGQAHRVRLRNGEEFFIPEDVTIICTMNTLDRSTEEVDDALFGRMAAVEFPPRVEDLHAMLGAHGVPEELAQKVRELFGTILRSYALGHGYFAEFAADTNPISYYLTRIRPVLQKHLENHRDDELAAIDETVNHLFA